MFDKIRNDQLIDPRLIIIIPTANESMDHTNTAQKVDFFVTEELVG